MEQHSLCTSFPTKDLSTPRKPQGWKAMPFILGNETLERLASYGMLANFMVYLLTFFHMNQAPAANLINIWMGVTNFTPLLGAFISDALIGKFKTIAFASFASLLGLITLTLTAWLPQLHPPSCNSQQLPHGHHCKGPNNLQFGMLILGLGLLAIGTGGIRPCNIPFGVDQFDQTTEGGKKGIASFYNWYYITATLVSLITLTVVVYIQDNVSWVLGFGLPTILMVCSIVLFFVGTRIYVHQPPQGSLFSGIAGVLVSAHRKRRLLLPEDGETDVSFYDPPLKKAILLKLPLTNQYRFLNKAAIIEKNDENPEAGCANPWRLCSIQQVEELKCLLNIVPIWSACIISFISMAQQSTFTMSQALLMDRHLGPNFEVPAGSMVIITMITIGIWVLLYDRIVVPFLRKLTKIEGGITILQRIGIGAIFSILSMVAAGIVERERRSRANSQPQSPMSVFWLSPQLVLLGLCEAFNVIGQIEFYNTEFPEHMRSIGNSIFSCSFAGANYLSSLMITIVHHSTGTSSHPNWLTNDLNLGRLDYFYFLLAGLCAMNFIYYLVCARRYRYKTIVQVEDEP
ncbi:putative nitrate transporter [Tripterygium wilfordii]|uniref:Putative nitrate transporter n=1 Tax=Tripterygium wilfordii TaxID=458696 RepID=A0A7J7DJY0_TRIWF|nr:protein NRT1/ PTR FAMILY 2.13-like [Tripterygium wilfordii]KAF5746618.1 putative nitrate transporter [Tripterygium wilfordii]